MASEVNIQFSSLVLSLLACQFFQKKLGRLPISHLLPGRLGNNWPVNLSESGTFLCFLKNLFIYLFIYLLAALGLRCCAWAFSSCGERGLLFVAVCGLLIAVASLCCRAQALGTWAAVVVACGLSSCGTRALECRPSSCGTRYQLLRGMWDLSGPGLEPVSPELTGGFPTTAPPGKSLAPFL